MFVVAKPVGQPVQSRDPSAKTLVAEWRARLGTDVQPIHRIDQPVSGCVVFARDRDGAAPLFAAFQNGTIERTYLAVVTGTPPQERDEIADPIAVDDAGNRSRIDQHGKIATLSYRMIGQTTHHSILLVRLATGRHHQIRVQLASRGMSVVGDTKYGARRPLRDGGIALHAWRLRIPSQFTKIPITITAQTPDRSLWRAVDDVLIERALYGVGD
jgi:23S rRNA pseudouridine1911/1915/1917 synthase